MPILLSCLFKMAGAVEAITHICCLPYIDTLNKSQENGTSILSFLEAQHKFAPYFLDDAVINGLGECDLGAPDGLAKTLIVCPLLCEVGHQAVEEGIPTEIHVAGGDPVVPVIQVHLL